MAVNGAAQTTEDDIIQGALAQDSGGTEDVQVDGDQAQASPSPSPAGQGGAATGKPGAANATGQQQQPAGQQQQQQRTTQAPPRNPGDLVDRNGNVLATAGAERRVFEKAARYIDAEYKQQLTTVTAQLEALQQANNQWQQLGLNASEASTGHALMAAFKKNPVEVVKYLLTEVRKQGHSVEGLGGSADLDAYASLLDERLAPLTANHEAALQRQQVLGEIEEEYTGFLGQYPDAITHEDDIAKLLDADPNISPEVAYLKLQGFAFRNGLDWTKPLGPQYEARVAQGGQQQQQHQRGMPTGRGVQAAAQVTDGMVAHEKTPTKDIVRNAMLAAGYKF